MTALLIQAAKPWEEAYFVSWGGQLIEVNRQFGWRTLGGCQFAPGWLQQYARPSYSPPQLSEQYGVAGPQGFVPLPQALAEPVRDNPFAPPLLTTQGWAQSCWAQSGGDRARFGDCMVRGMVGQRELAAYDCVRSSGDRAASAICMVGALGGERERKLASMVATCRQQFGANYDRYPLCMASMGVDVGGDVGKLLACAQQQGQSGNVSLLGAAVCYGAGSLNMNPETQIIVQCAATTGGEPYAFAGCAGGQLTARELDKCLTGGVGGPGGCFGPNNDIVKALQGAGNLLQQQFGPTNTLVQTWNSAYHDLTQGPGPNNEVRKAFRNVGNEIGRQFGPNNDIRKAVEKVVPRIRIKF